jgi:phage baseplate assembly protein W
MILSDFAAVFSEGDIQNPMEIVLNGPVGTDNTTHLFGVNVQV